MGGRNRRTVSAGSGLVVKVVAHDGDGLVEEAGDLFLGEGLEGFGEEVGVVATAGLDEDLLDGGALMRFVSSHVFLV